MDGSSWIYLLDLTIPQKSTFVQVMKTIILWAVLDVHLATLSEILTCPTRLVQIHYNAPHHRAQWHFTRALTKLTMACSQHVCVHSTSSTCITLLVYLEGKFMKWNLSFAMEWVFCFLKCLATLLHSFRPDIHWVYISHAKMKKEIFATSATICRVMPLDPARCS